VLKFFLRAPPHFRESCRYFRAGTFREASSARRTTIAALLYPAVAAAIAAVAAFALSSGEDGDEAANGPEHKAAALPRRRSTTRLPPALPLDEEEASLLLRGWIPGYDGARAQTWTRANAWVAAVDTDHGRLKVSTAQHGPFLLFRVEAEAEDSEAAALVSLFREVDLLPQWNRGVRSAELEELRRPSEMVAHALVSFPSIMWIPLPACVVRLHARLHAVQGRGGTGDGTPPSLLLIATSAGAGARSTAPLPQPATLNLNPQPRTPNPGPVAPWP